MADTPDTAKAIELLRSRIGVLGVSLTPAQVRDLVECFAAAVNIRDYLRSPSRVDDMDAFRQLESAIAKVCKGVLNNG